MILTQARIPYDIVARPWKDGGFRDSYAWHKRVWEAFPGSPEASRDFLTRLDDTGHDFRLLILSQEPPSRPDWCPSDQWQSKTIADTFFQHRHYQFSLLANPTRKRVVRDPDGHRKKNGRREALVSRQDLIDWMSRKGEQNGFAPDLVTLKTLPRPRQAFLKKGSAGLHCATEFTGTLEVTDPELFLHAAHSGIGSAKAFGFGMLCLSPL
ncbi:CRISPR system Cascade subunit CasE [Haloferula luteola]|uniref:CRISPR system Cascade subunit CasE n=1 Tax=Haloferula luteola TaxID=595692 RepID=A0A840V1M2_9BACT|nr:type I-E CRISPR-associated protein Cas6/Cse3/CasE [Haloferula luteola]MBB5350956.1 CRISPR system Cascade subunit CasE [Haloferula luteola]